MNDTERKKDQDSREEYLRQERIAVGRICGCGACLCCNELKANRAKDWTGAPLAYRIPGLGRFSP